jgi:hypothetical protein
MERRWLTTVAGTQMTYHITIHLGDCLLLLAADQTLTLSVLVDHLSLLSSILFLHALLDKPPLIDLPKPAKFRFFHPSY